MNKQTKDKFTRLDYLAVIPLLLMLGITFLMLLMDLAMPTMDQGQYTSYPAFFRFVNVLVIVSGILFYSIYYFKDRKTLVSRARENIVPVICFAAFIVLMIISTFINGFNSMVLSGVPYRYISIITLGAFIIFYMPMSGMIRSEKFRTFLLLAYIAVADLIGILVLADRYFYAIPAFREKKDISGIFFNGNHYGYFLVMAILLALGILLYEERSALRVFSGVSFVFNLAILGMNGSLGCILAVGLGVLISVAFTFAHRREQLKFNLVLLGVLALAGALFLAISGMLASIRDDVTLFLAGDSQAGHNRMLLWELTMDKIAERPLFGYGCEGLRDYLMDACGRANPHSEVLNLASWFGVPALITYMIGTISLFVKGFTGGRCPAALLAAFGYLVSSLAGVPMFYTLPFFFVFLGMATA